VLLKAGLDWDRLADVWAYVRGFDVPNSLLIVRNGWVAGEWSNYSDPRGIASCTKSLTGLSMAKLFDLSDAGKTSRRVGPEDFAHAYLPGSWARDPRMKDIRIRHLLTMSSGLAPYDGPYPKTGTEYFDIVLSTGFEAAPGTVWAYASVPIDLMSLVIQTVTGQTEKEFFDREIGGPIGLAPVSWPTMGETPHTGGSGGPGGGARFTARDLARVGYLLLRRGAWGDRQVVSAGRVDLFTRWAPWLESATFRTPNFSRTADAQTYYGYTFWTNRTGILGPAVPVDAYWMSGWGKQTCAVVPSLDLVVVRLGAHRRLNDHPEFYREVWSRIMAAVR
jgi:CubicO group peptidase (beta-lactamase class C family)